MEQFFTVSSMSVFMLTQYIDSHASNHFFSMPMWFRYSFFNVLSYSDVGTIILLLFMAILLLTAISQLNNQYGCSSFPIFVDGKPQITYSDRILKHSSSSVANLISSTVMQFGMSGM